MKSRESILQAAKTLFGQHGFNGASVRDIAELAGANPASIHYHFGSKEGLFKEVSHHCLLKTQRVHSVLKTTPKSLDELKLTLSHFFNLFLELRMEDEAGYIFINRNLDTILDLAPEAFEQDIWAVVESLEGLIKRSKKNKLLKSDLDTHMLASMMFSAFCHLYRDESIHSKFKKAKPFDERYRRNYVETTLESILFGARLP